MKILFCNIANMKYYKGNLPGVDEPRYGGEYVQQWGDGGEVYNFFPTAVDGENVCLGFVETKSTNRKTVNQLYVEKIEGVFPEDAPEAEGVLVIWCAIHNNYDDSGRTAVMGWYRNATVYREYQKIPVSLEDGGTELATYNIKANTYDCVLLPYGERNDHVWWVPRKRKGRPVPSDLGRQMSGLLRRSARRSMYISLCRKLIPIRERTGCGNLCQRREINRYADRIH